MALCRTARPTPVANFGPTLSQAEFERRIVALDVSSSAMADKAGVQATQRAEFDLLIDYKLGTSFPAKRREALWRAREKMQRHFALRVLGSMLTNPLNPSNGLAKAQVKAFAKILDTEELAMFLGYSREEVRRFL